MSQLYVVYLGGKLAEGRMGEDHEVVVVVADDLTAARKAAKGKWSGVGDPHIDSVRLIDLIDGHLVTLTPVAVKDHSPIDGTWVP